MSDMRLINAIHDHIALVQDAVYEVERVARNLRSVGIDRAADDIARAVAHLNETAKAISAAHIDDVHGQIAHGEFMVGGMLTLVANGQLTPKPKEPSDD